MPGTGNGCRRQIATGATAAEYTPAPVQAKTRLQPEWQSCFDQSSRVPGHCDGAENRRHSGRKTACSRQGCAGTGTCPFVVMTSGLARQQQGTFYAHERHSDHSGPVFRGDLPVIHILRGTAGAGRYDEQQVAQCREAQGKEIGLKERQPEWTEGRLDSASGTEDARRDEVFAELWLVI